MSTSYTTVTYPYTGDYRMDTLLEGLDYRWNAGSSLGAPVTVTYSFMRAEPIYGGTNMDGDYGFLPFTSAQMSAVRQIFAKLQSELNVRFVEVADGATSFGQIRFGGNYQSVSTGYAWLPNSTGDAKGGDVWIDVTSYSNLYPTAANGGYAVLLHEIGHALGLKHPGDYNAGQPASLEPGNYLGGAEDTTNYTVMSYNDAAGGQARDWYGTYDLLTLKTLYGANPNYNAGDNVYRYGDSAGALLGVIDDAAGNDTIDLSSLTIGSTVDMRPGAFSSIGRSGGASAVNNVSIDLTTRIENFVGTAYSDFVTGNDANNRFTLGGGANQAAGGAGTDTAVYTGLRAGYQVSQADGVIRVSGANVNDTLRSIERVEFANGKFAFDIASVAGLTAKVLGAVFGAPAVSNANFVGIGLSLFDGGMGYSDVMHFALNARLGASASNSAVVDLLYTNVVGSAPDASQHAYYQGLLDSGAISRDNLGIVAADTAINADHIGLVGLAANGLQFA